MQLLFRLLYLSAAIALFLIFFYFGRSWFGSENAQILIAFLVGIGVSFCTMQSLYLFKGYTDFRQFKTVNENAVIGFLKKVIVAISGIGTIMLLVIQFVLVKPVISFKDGVFAMAKIIHVQDMTSHRGTKYQVDVSFKTEENIQVEAKDMIFLAERKYVQGQDSVPITYSRSNPQRIVLITTQDKLQRIQTGN